jgi:hypothetical protein
VTVRLTDVPDLCCSPYDQTCWIQLCAGTVLISAATTKTDFVALDTLVPKSHHQFLLGASLVCGILGEQRLGQCALFPTLCAFAVYVHPLRSRVFSEVVQGKLCS